MNNSLLRYGLFAAAVLIVINVIQFLMMGTPDPEDYRIGEIIGYTTIVVSLLFVFFGIKSRRDHELGGYISFMQGLGAGVVITLFPSIAFGIFNWIYMKVLAPGFAEQYWAHSLKQAESSMNAAEYQAFIQQMEASKDLYMHPLFQSALMFVTVFLIGLIISIISAWVLKRTPEVPTD